MVSMTLRSGCNIVPHFNMKLNKIIGGIIFALPLTCFLFIHYFFDVDITVKTAITFITNMLIFIFVIFCVHFGLAFWNCGDKH